LKSVSFARRKDRKGDPKFTKYCVFGSYGSLKITENGTFQQITYDFLLAFHSNCFPILYRFRDIASYMLKVANIFPTAGAFRAAVGSDPTA